MNSTFFRTGQYSPFMSIKMANEVNCGVLYPKRIPTVETNNQVDDCAASEVSPTEQARGYSGKERKLHR